jgi:hypothetical protein
LVGGPGFEPGASRSRTLRPLVQKSSKRSLSVRKFLRSQPLRPDLQRFSAGLLHELLSRVLWSAALHEPVANSTTVPPAAHLLGDFSSNLQTRVARSSRFESFFCRIATRTTTRDQSNAYAGIRDVHQRPARSVVRLSNMSGLQARDGGPPRPAQGPISRRCSERAPRRSSR